MRYFTLLFALLLCTCVSAQNALQGTITDQATGEALPFASIYVQETQTGTASNADGEFYVQLGSGTYTVVFPVLGLRNTGKESEWLAAVGR